VPLPEILPFGPLGCGRLDLKLFQSAFVGYWVDQHHAGNGYVPEAVVLTLRYAFDEAESPDRIETR